MVTFSEIFRTISWLQYIYITFLFLENTSSIYNTYRNIFILLHAFLGTKRILCTWAVALPSPFRAAHHDSSLARPKSQRVHAACAASSSPRGKISGTTLCSTASLPRRLPRRSYLLREIRRQLMPPYEREGKNDSSHRRSPRNFGAATASRRL